MLKCFLIRPSDGPVVDCQFTVFDFDESLSAGTSILGFVIPVENLYILHPFFDSSKQFQPSYSTVFHYALVSSYCSIHKSDL